MSGRGNIVQLEQKILVRDESQRQATAKKEGMLRTWSESMMVLKEGTCPTIFSTVLGTNKGLFNSAWFERSG